MKAVYNAVAAIIDPQKPNRERCKTFRKIDSAVYDMYALSWKKILNINNTGLLKKTFHCCYHFKY